MNLLNCGFSVMMGALLSATAFAAGPAPAAKGEAPGAANEAKIKRILNDPDLYAGLGYADYEGADIGDARKKAVENASEDLSRHIRVRVESVTKDALSYSAKGKKHSEEESFDRVVKSFVDQVLNQSRDEEFIDYPKPGTLAVVAYVNKQAADKDIQQDLNAKKDRVVGLVHEAGAAFDGKNFPSALRDYLSARDKLDLFFEGMPVNASLEKGGAPREIGAYVEGRIEDLVGGLELKPFNDFVKYTAAGKPRGGLAVGAGFRAGKGEGEGVAKLPLIVRFSTGAGRPAQAKLTTDAFGKAVIPLDWVDPEQTEAALEVSLDTEAFPGLGARAVLPHCAIGLQRSKTVAYGVRFVNGNSKAGLRSMEEGVRGLLSTAGYGYVKVSLGGDDVEKAQIDRAREAHADYLLAIHLTATGRQEPDFGLYSASVESSFSMNNLLDGTEVFSSSGPSAKGFGSSLAGAGWNAANKIEKALLQKVKDRVGAIR